MQQMHYGGQIQTVEGKSADWLTVSQSAFPLSCWKHLDNLSPRVNKVGNTGLVVFRRLSLSTKCKIQTKATWILMIKNPVKLSVTWQDLKLLIFKEDKCYLHRRYIRTLQLSSGTP